MLTTLDLLKRPLRRFLTVGNGKGPPKKSGIRVFTQLGAVADVQFQQL